MCIRLLVNFFSEEFMLKLSKILYLQNQYLQLFHTIISCRAKGRVLEIIYRKKEFTQEDEKKLDHGAKYIAACHNV